MAGIIIVAIVSFIVGFAWGTGWMTFRVEYLRKRIDAAARRRWRFR